MQVNSPGWRIRSATRGAQGAGSARPGLPPEFLTDDSRVVEEVIVEPAPATRGQPASTAVLDLTAEVEPGQVAILAVRHASNALTFHAPVQSTTRGLRGPSEARFQVAIRRSTATRGLGSQAVKAILVKVARLGGDRLVSLALSKLVAAFEKQSWKKRGLREGWLRVTKETLAAGRLAQGRPVSPERSLLFVHGTFSNAASAFRGLTASTFFDRVKEIYGDRIFAFDHFSLSRTPDENVRMLLEGLPEQTTTFDVIAHSRGGLVLRTLVERATQFGSLAKRFKLGTAVLVASPNDGTPLATPNRWDQTVGWLANILEIFPDNPFTTGAEFVANGLVWVANHASGDIPGLHAMDGEGDPIRAIQAPPGPPANAYSALVANYSPTDDVLRRLIDAGLDQFFGSANDLVVPSEGGWRIDRSGAGHIPASRIGCFGPGGNLANDSVTHVGFFPHAETVDFVVKALHGQEQALSRVDPRKPLPDRRLVRGEAGPVPLSPATRVAGPAAAGRRGRAKAVVPDERLKVSVTNGDLMFEREALLLGHYASTKLTGTEKVMDGLIGGAMERSLKVGDYPLAVGTHEVFINTQIDERGIEIPRPAAVVVVGLGSEGKLKPGDLVKTVRLAVIGWARRLTEPGLKQPKRQTFDLASTLIGSGGTGIAAGQAARLIAQGVWEANDSLRDESGGDKRWPRCGHLHLIELYLDRATEAWNALRLQQVVTPDCFAMEEVVRHGTGALQRPPDSGYRGADYDFITVEAKGGSNGESTLEYTLDTRRARSEIRAQRAQGDLIRDLVATASNDQNRDRQIGRTLFNLVVPVELEPFLADSGEMQISLDLETAGIPWEFLDTERSSTSAERLPWAIRGKLLRKLRLEEFREQVVDAETDASALIIGEPACPPGFARLEGARNEAIQVNSCLTGPDGLTADKITLLAAADASQPGPDADRIINAMFEKTWRIVHIAGHGMPPAGRKAGGVVLSNKTFLGAVEIESMRVVPELVFINCCHLGRITGSDVVPTPDTRYDRARFASGVAGALIKIGVRCVVAAGWAVDDDAASEFAAAFYASLLRGNRFIDAVGEARLLTFQNHPGANTWAAYQCYGDADWQFRATPPSADRPTGTAKDFSGVASATALRLELDRIIVQTRSQGLNPSTQVRKLQALEGLLSKPAARAQWAKSGAVAESFGEAYAEAGALEDALQWYERAVNAPDGRASTRAAEQLANVRSRLAWEIVDKAVRHRDEMIRLQKDATIPAARKSARAARSDAQEKLDRAIVTARSLIERALSLLADLIGFRSTMERESLVGSACKRRALVSLAAGHAASVRRDLTAMKNAYRQALRAGTSEEGADLYYPALNCLAADVAIGAGKNSRAGLDARFVKIVENTLEAKSGANAEFWSVAGSIELGQFQAIAARRLAANRLHLERQYSNLYQRAKAPRLWSSVYDNSMLVLGSYSRRRGSAKEGRAADELLSLLRTFAHPADGPVST